MPPTTPLEDSLYESVQTVLHYLTKRHVAKSEYFEVLGILQNAVRLYENKRYSTKRL